ncbi:MAG TPA: arsinothricin resistance N-acetyltransferase ArsN1 family B [Ktedonobacterales bacterium]|nr:arsinothricin resistance N-acetyltransferase ArsN1 family B [Ktedonobacterales bacterium]
MAPIIRLAHLEDAPAIQAIYAPIVISTPTSFELTPPTVEEMRQRIEQKLLTHPWVVYEAQGKVVGSAYASVYRARAAYQWSVEVSVYLHEQWRGQGIGRALYTSLFALLRLQGFYSVYAGITLPNPASVALHETMGLRPLGVYQRVGYKLGAWHDVGWWQGTLQPHLFEPTAPLSLPEAQALDGWTAALERGTILFTPHQ